MAEFYSPDCSPNYSSELQLRTTAPNYSPGRRRL